MRIRTIAAAAAMASMAFAALPATAQAPQGAAEALARVQSGESASQYAQYRRYYAAPPPYAYQRPRVYQRRTYAAPPRYYRRDRGNAAAAGIAGLAAGAIIGGAIASQQAQAAPQYVAPNSAVAYCMQRFRSYDLASGTYMGYDGIRRRCP